MNRYKATIILFIVSFGFLLTYPFHTSFIGGMLSSSFCAAMIGGFADWFGVSALFRKPLGISFRTEIIPKNREKILVALSDMVGNELLTKESLKNLLNKHNISKLLVKFLTTGNEKEQIKQKVNKIVQDIIRKVNPKEVGTFIDRFVKDNISKIKLVYLIENAISISMRNGYYDKIMDFIIKELATISAHKPVKILITKMVQEIIHNYESGSKRRRFTNTVIFDLLLHASPADIAEIIQGKLIEYLNELSQSHHETRLKLAQWINQRIEYLKSDLELQRKLEQWKLEQIEHKLDISGLVAEFISKYRLEDIQESAEYIKLCDTIGGEIDNFIHKFSIDETWQSKFDDYAKRILLEFVENNHREISIMIRENLDKYSNEMLVNLIENKAGNDLQIIRINGSVVGGFVGLMTFILTFWIS